MTLQRDAAADTQQQLSSWFRRWRSPLRAFLLGRASVPPSDVDDVAQEVFLRLMRYERVALIDNPQAYLFRMASNVAAEWAIRARRRRPHEPEWLSTLVAKEQPEIEALRDSVRADLARALGTLSGRQQQMLRLVFSEGLTQNEIAFRLGETPRTVRRQLARSFEKLRQLMDVDRMETVAHGRE